ncbi:MAG: hypothetical protein IJT55_05805 [Prevotella sp.]|nr:hypothetical protein [Prevotella sp.]
MKFKKILPLLLLLCSCQCTFADDKNDILNTMRRATQFMMNSVSLHGGFVWNYTEDFSRRWGEIEARPTMIWMQSTSTPEVGHVLLDAYHATGDEYYYQQACKVVGAILDAQLECGGWNYLHDYAGEESMKEWYNTIGKQAWRLEEFQHYYGNATFDDDVTYHPASLLLRIYLEKKEKRFLDPLNKTIDFYLKSQYDNGGWPQRYPLRYDHQFQGRPDYSSYITLNDGVMENNIDFLMQCYYALDRKDLKKHIEKAMYVMRDMQQPLPYAGWSDQYTLDLKPAQARSYEPRAVNTATTIRMMRLMQRFYQMTGDKSFLRGLENACQFVCSQALPDSVVRLWRSTNLNEGDILVPRFVDPDTGKPHFVHRKGGNVKNGIYYTDEDIRQTIGHYSSAARISARQVQQIVRESATLKVTGWQKPHSLRYYYFNGGSSRGRSVRRVIESLTPRGCWITPLTMMSNPYKPIPADMEETSEDRQYINTFVGDEYDTSPYSDRKTLGIKVGDYVANMNVLIGALKKQGSPEDRISLANKDIRMEVCRYCARIMTLSVPDKKGKMQDVVLGFDDEDGYRRVRQNFGATVGRYLGRINGATFTLDGKQYQLQNYGKGDISHGGYPGFAHKEWTVKRQTPSSVTLEYLSPDGENGFPGNLLMQVTMTLTDDGALHLSYDATTDQPTVLNPSNHSFFNISANHLQTIEEEILRVDADSIAVYDAKKRLTGEMMAVKGTPFDFLTPKKIGLRIDENDTQLNVTKGYDHTWRLNHSGDLSRVAAELYDKNSGITLSVYTTEPALHIYTANGLNGSIEGKHHQRYPRRSAICFETCHFADSPNKPQFPTTVLRPGEKFHSETIFRFGRR